RRQADPFAPGTVWYNRCHPLQRSARQFAVRRRRSGLLPCRAVRFGPAAEYSTADGASSQTTPTLLGRLQQAPSDQAAWSEFVDRYGPRIYRWCRHWGLQENDAEEVTQIVLIKLVEKLRTFRYDPARSFRGWLRTLTYHAWSDFVECQQRAGA